MRVIALRKLREFWEQGRGELAGPLRAWFKMAEESNWTNFAAVKKDFPSVDQVGDKLIFNIAGNQYRLIVAVDYARKGILVKWIGTHAEYDKLKVDEL